MKDLVFITGNEHKAHYLAKWLGIPVERRKLDLDELQSLDLRTVVEHKVRQAYAIAQQPALVEDVALTFTAMGRLPGTLIKWFLEELGKEGLVKLGDGLDHREAKAEIMYGLYDGKAMHFFHAERVGYIAEYPRGDNNFGWNAIFIPEGETRTYAELSDDEFRSVSHRAEAIAKLGDFLRQRQA
jgi:non-canonical purine NTP pyrophosphatase (RdgB/HAM1 family)